MENIQASENMCLPHAWLQIQGRVRQFLNLTTVTIVKAAQTQVA